jgi:hypothetical protein
MQYTYYGDGEIKVLGSAKQFRRLYIYHKYDRSSVVRFKQNDIAYIKRKAELGILEKIVIERVYLKNTIKTFYKNVNFYEDKLKSLYREDEIITYAEAQDIIGMGFRESKGFKKQIVEDQVKIQQLNDNKYEPGDSVYSLISAEKGVLQKVGIKKYLQNMVYSDFFGNLWNENELVILEEANIAISQYVERSERPIMLTPVEPAPYVRPPKFAVGDILASINYAKKGQLKILIVKNIFKNYIYQDLINDLWEESDLDTKENARSIAIEYLEEQKQQIFEAIRKENE